MKRCQTCNGDFAVGLDVGTTKICAMAGKWEEGRMKILSVGSSPSNGLRKGIVVDMDETASSIKKALDLIEGATGLKVKSVFAGIAGGHIKGFNGYGAVSIKNMVREDDVRRLMESAGAAYVPVDREILHVIPSGFRLDGNNGIIDPLGMSGSRLEARVHIITGSLTSVRNLIKCCEMAGTQVDNIVLEPLASADAVLDANERERGVALVDIGGGTTDIAAYKEGMLRHTAVLALGGNHITNDIAVGLGIPASEAERIKKAYGYSRTGMIDERGDIEIKDGDGKLKKIPKKYLIEIIQSRCEEIMMLVRKEAEDDCSGVVLTGGTSLLRGIDTLAESILGLPVRIGIPEKIVNKSIVNGPEYATGVGLTLYGLTHPERGDDAHSPELFTSSGILKRMKCWIEGYFK